jgi:hypothetical protein
VRIRRTNEPLSSQLATRVGRCAIDSDTVCYLRGEHELDLLSSLFAGPSRTLSPACIGTAQLDIRREGALHVIDRVHVT